MNKSDLINVVAGRAKHIALKDMEVIVNEIFSSMTDSLKNGERIEIRGFGSFEVRERKPRIGRNPKSGEKVQVGKRKVPFFKVGKELRERINNNGLELRKVENC